MKTDVSPVPAVTGPEGISETPVAPPPDARRKRGLKWIVALAVVAIAGLAVLALVFHVFAPAAAEGIVALSGRIEGDDSAIAAKLTGRIREIRFREGDRVSAGEVMVELDDEQVRARERQSEAAVEQAEAALQASARQVRVLSEQASESRLGVDQSRRDAEGRVSEADARVAAARAALAQARANYSMARFNAQAYAKLLEKDEVSRQQALEMQSAADAQAAAVEADEKQVEASLGALRTAQAALVNPDIHRAQLAAIEEQISQQKAQIDQARATAVRARAEFAEAQATRRDLLVLAPFDGTVATRLAEPGEVVTVGTPLLTLVNLNRVYLRGFIPEGAIGRVRLGQEARVYLDSAPKRGLAAVVTRIDPEASFTPENTYFRDDRVKQVVGVKLQLRAPAGFAKPGMPADGEILVSGAWPEAGGGAR